MKKSLIISYRSLRKMEIYMNWTAGKSFQLIMGQLMMTHF